MKKIFKWIAMTAILVLVMAVGGLLAYRFLYSQGVVESYGVNTGHGYPKVLVLTQQSAFKERVMHGLIERLSGKPVALHVVDATKADQLELSDWEHIVVLAAIESGEPPAPVRGLISSGLGRDRMMVAVTAGSGGWNGKPEGVDMVASASKMDDALAMTNRIVGWISDVVLKNNAVL